MRIVFVIDIEAPDIPLEPDHTARKVGQVVQELREDGLKIRTVSAAINEDRECVLACVGDPEYTSSD